MTRTAIQQNDRTGLRTRGWVIWAAVFMAAGWIASSAAPAGAVDFGNLPLRVEDATGRHNDALAEFRIVLAGKRAALNASDLCRDPMLLRLIAQCVTHHDAATNALSQMQRRVPSGKVLSVENQRALDRATRLVNQMPKLTTSALELADASDCDPMRIALHVTDQYAEDEEARSLESRQERAAFLDDLFTDMTEDAEAAASETEDRPHPASSDWDQSRFSALYSRYHAASDEFRKASADFLDRLDLLSAYGEEICHDQALAYSYSESQRTGLALAQIFEAIFGMVYPAVPFEMYQQTLIAPGIADAYAMRWPIEDQVAFAEVGNDFLNMSAVFDYLDAELAAKAEGCDPEELADQGNRTAEEGQDPETNLDAGGGIDGTGGGPFGLTANFTGSPTSGDAPLTVNFEDRSMGEIDTWSWTFGDGGSSSAQNPSYTFEDEGTWTVSLTVSGPDGSDTETKAGYISVGGDGGSLRYELIGAPSRQYEDTYAGCSQGGSGGLTIEVGDVQFPAEVRPDGSYTVRVPVQWSVSGTDVTQVNFVVVVYFFDERQESDQIRQFSGNQTFQFNFSGAEINFARDHGAILAQMGGGVECESGSSDDGVSVTITQAYTRQGSN